MSSLKRKLDAVFSRYIRLRDTHGNSGARCCSCGKWFPVEDLDAGHYIPRGKGPTRYDERNVHVQCHGCNRFRDGNLPGYAVFMQRKYGPDILVDLLEKSKQDHRWRVTDLRELLAEYQQKLEAL